MRKILRITAAILAALLLLTALPACAADAELSFTEEGENLETVIIPIAQLNTNGSNGDHANDDYMTASLENDYRTMTELTSASTSYFRYDNAFYPRVKQVRDDLYVMFYHYGKLGLHMYYVTSSDGVNWNAPQVLWNAADHRLTYEGGELDGYSEKYAAVNPDACVLDNGDILCVYAVRPPKGYKTYTDLSGIYMMRGTVDKNDNITWSEETRIYTGQSWEPFIMQRTDGVIEVYFTQIAPYIVKYGFDDYKRSSGTGYITSADGGYSWTPDIQPGDKNLYRATTVLQQEIGERNGAMYFSGQMPSAVQLYNGKTLLTVETHDLDLKFRTSYAVSGENGNWKALELTEEGPETLVENAYDAASPYIARFESGETYLTYQKNGRLYGRIGKPDGTAFANRDFLVLPNAPGIWGSTCVVGSHAVLSVNPTKSGDNYGIAIVRSYLNHRINAPHAAISVDGYTNDWEGNTDALFVGSETQAQITLRVAHDDDNLYFLISRLDYYVTDGDTATICIAAGATSDYRITVGLNGIQSIAYYEGDILKRTVEGGSAAVKVLGTANNNEDKDEGMVAEVAIPKSLVGLTGQNSFKVRPALSNTDSSGATSDTLTGASVYATAQWPAVVLD